MYDCEKCIEKMGVYIDGELEAAETADFESHVAQCSECAGMLETMKILMLETSALMEEPPNSLHAGIMAEIHKEKDVSPPRKRFKYPFTLIAAVAALVILAVSGTFGDIDKIYLFKDMAGSANNASGASAETAAMAEMAPQSAQMMFEVRSAPENANAGGSLPEDELSENTQSMPEESIKIETTALSAKNVEETDGSVDTDMASFVDQISDDCDKTFAWCQVVTAEDIDVPEYFDIYKQVHFSESLTYIVVPSDEDARAKIRYAILKSGVNAEQIPGNDIQSENALVMFIKE